MRILKQMKRIPCKLCKTEILENTAENTGGYCMPCSRKVEAKRGRRKAQACQLVKAPSEVRESFKKQNRGAYDFDWWVANDKIITKYCEFSSELHIDKGEEPDLRMLQIFEIVKKNVKEDIDLIVDLVEAHFSWILENWGEEVTRTDDLGKNTPRNLILKSHGNARIIISKDDGEYYSNLAFDAPYDEEHGVEIEYESGKVTMINGEEFKLVDGKPVLEI